ncbi:snRNA-activating protein complex subunit 4 isoform X2 [Dermacentor silvarum]|uniref:snRNA-activating protein complex subunit 4 isoform X2 n=1 Tax=Dermacentor silvarum TaxID=543639 RepID=UPI002100DF32|nr:snRNA-activating protein complex subunit 4 isoform X2 [Dermacentor silvarum]
MESGDSLPDYLRPLVISENVASDDSDEDENDYSDDDAWPILQSGYEPPSQQACNATSPDQGGPSGTAEEESLVGSSLAEMPTDLENCLALNRAQRALLESAIGEFAERLEKNRQLQRELPAQLSQRAQRPQKPRVRKNWYHSLVFHHPYFRDINGMPAPRNEDAIAKLANKELDPYLAPPMPWTTDENRMLVDAVKANLLMQSLEYLMDRKETLADRLLNTEDPEQSAELAERIDQLDKQVAQELKTGRSAFQCAAHYSSRLVTRHNMGPFSEEENHRLQQLISVCTEGDDIAWSQVSHFMGSRSKKQVMNRYNRSLHPGLQRGRWTAQEDVMLLIGVKLYKDCSWTKVASMLPGRTGGQCRDRYKDNFEQQIVSGPYTPDEDYSLLELVQKHGVGHWSKVVQEMPWRTASSALTRYRRLTEILGTKQPTVADLEKHSLQAPAASVNEARRARLTGLDKRLDLYRRICRQLTNKKLKEAALLLVKGRDESLDRETCLKLYQKMLQQHQTGRTLSNSQVQGHALNKAIAQYAQPLHRPMLPIMAAYEHQELQAVTNVLHDLHGLPKPPVDPDIEQVGTVPIFEEFFRKEVLGVPDEFQPSDANLVLPLLPPNETTVATYGRLLDRYANGNLADSLPALQDNSSFPELSAALDADSVDDIRCTECTSRSLLEDGLLSAGSSTSQQSCSRCEELRATRKNYDVLQARFISYFFWPALMDTLNVPETVELPPDTQKKRKKYYRAKSKLKKPWVKEKWKERKRLAAAAAAAVSAATSEQRAPDTEEATAEEAKGTAEEADTALASSAPNSAVDA